MTPWVFENIFLSENFRYIVDINKRQVDRRFNQWINICNIRSFMNKSSTEKQKHFPTLLLRSSSIVRDSRMQENLQTFFIKFKRIKVKQPKIFFLCDITDEPETQSI